MLLLLLNYVVLMALWKIDVHLINTLVIIIIIIIIHVKREIRPYTTGKETLPFLLSRNEFERVEHKKNTIMIVLPNKKVNV